MPRRSPPMYAGAILDPDLTPFGSDEVDRVLLAVGEEFPLAMDREEFAARLNTIAQYASLLGQASEAPSPKTNLEFLTDLQRAARWLGGLLPLHAVAGDAEGGEFGLHPSEGTLRLLAGPLAQVLQGHCEPPEADPSQSPAIRTLMDAGLTRPEDILEMVACICTLLDQAISLAKQDLPEAVASQATEPTVRALMQLYRDAFGRPIAFSRPGTSGEPGGPMIRFVQAACKVMGQTPAPATIAKIKQRHFRAG